MNDKDYIKDLFSDKLGNYEAKVNPELWNGIASQIGTTATTAGATGMSLLTKTIIGISAAAVIGVSTFVMLSDNSEEVNKISQQQNVVQESDVLISNENKEEDTAVEESTSDNQENTLQEQVSESLSEDETQMEFIPAEDGGVFVEYVPTQEDGVLKERKPEDVADTQDNYENNTQDPLIEEVIEQEQLPEEIPAEENSLANVNYKLGALPNVFTPNGDGRNDLFEIESENLTEFTIVVYNSNNTVVFQSNDPYFKWDGTVQGSPVPEGRYVYSISSKELASSDKPKRISPLVIKR